MTMKHHLLIISACIAVSGCSQDADEPAPEPEVSAVEALAEEELGDRFDLRAFHDRVVGFGGITLPMLQASRRLPKGPVWH